MSKQSDISVVDDSREILEIIEHEFINDHDYKFRFYSSGSVFLDGLSNDVDLVIIDIHMPDFDIMDAIEKIDEVSPMAYVIIISADRDFDGLKHLLNMGIFRFCEKGERDFLPNLRNYIKAAHRKITIRKGFISGN